MNLREPRRSHDADYPRRLLERLQRESSERGHKTSSYPELCDMVAIPRDLRAALLKTLVGKGYVQLEGGDRVSIPPPGSSWYLRPSPERLLPQRRPRRAGWHDQRPG